MKAKLAHDWPYRNIDYCQWSSDLELQDIGKVGMTSK